MTLGERAKELYENFSRYAEDLYPRRYTKLRCLELAEMEQRIKYLAKEKQSTIVAHNYLTPDFHEIAEKIGDSLGLAHYVRDKDTRRVDFQSVFFMGATAKIIVGDRTRVYVPDTPQVLGCSLVFGTDYQWIQNWKNKYPDGILITYVNSDAYTKSISDFISTSRNTDRIIMYVIKNYPGRRILVLPDKFLGWVMKTRALSALKEEGMEIDPDLIDIYQYRKGEYNASCYVHERIDTNTLDEVLDSDAELLIHPECGCASSCLLKLQQGIIPHGKAYFLSTEQMVMHAKESRSRKFIVATEKGLIYRLRKELPEKKFLPISFEAECKYMKANTVEKLLSSLENDKKEIVLCDDCCDPKNPYEDESVIHIQRFLAAKAKQAIELMLSIQ